MLGLCGFFMGGYPSVTGLITGPYFMLRFAATGGIFTHPRGAIQQLYFSGLFTCVCCRPGQWHKNHHNFYLQALQSTAVTILKSEEYC